jgi:hypothetical protein
MFSLLAGERLNGVLNFYQPSDIYQKLFLNDWSLLIVLILLLMIFLGKPLINYWAIKHNQRKDDLFFLEFFARFFFPAFSLVFIDMNAKVEVLDIFGFLLVMIGCIFHFLGIDEYSANQEAMSAIEAIKPLFRYKSPHDLE